MDVKKHSGSLPVLRGLRDAACLGQVALAPAMVKLRIARILESQ